MKAVLFDIDNTLLLKAPGIPQKWRDVLLEYGIERSLEDTQRAFAECEMWVGRQTQRENATGIRLSNEAFADGVALAVADKFGFSRADISVDAVRVSEDLTAEEIRLTLRGKASLADTRGIRSYLIENGICDRAEIIIFGS